MSKLQDDAWIISPHGKEAQDVAEQCTGCESSFSVVVRRHLCCECNRIYCGRCSKIRTNAKNGSLVRRRVCMDCRPAVTPASSLSQRSTESELACGEGGSRTVALVEIFDEERDVTNRQQQEQEQQGQEQGQAQTRPVLRQIDSNILSSLCDAGEDKVSSAQVLRGEGGAVDSNCSTPLVPFDASALLSSPRSTSTSTSPSPTPLSSPSSEGVGVPGSPFAHKGTMSAGLLVRMAELRGATTPAPARSASASATHPTLTITASASSAFHQHAQSAVKAMEGQTQTQTLPVEALTLQFCSEVDQSSTWTEVKGEAKAGDKADEEAESCAIAPAPHEQYQQSVEAAKQGQMLVQAQTQTQVQTHAQTQALIVQFSEADAGETWTDIEEEAETESKERVGASDIGSEQSSSMWSMLRCIVLLAVLVSWSVPHIYMPHMLNMHSTLSISDVRAEFPGSPQSPALTAHTESAAFPKFPAFPGTGSVYEGMIAGLEGVMTYLEAMGVGGMGMGGVGMGKPPAQRAEFSTGLGAGSVGVGVNAGVGMSEGVGAQAKGLSVAVTDVLVGGEADTPTSAPTSAPTPAWAGAWFSAHEQEHHLEPIPVSFKISFVGGRKSIGERLTGRLGNELNALGREIASAKRAVARVWVQWGVRGDRYKKRNGGWDGGAASTAVGPSSQARHIPTPVM